MVRLFRAVASFIQSVLDVVLPRKERTVRTEHYSFEDIPTAPSEHEACGVPITTLLSYRDRIVEDIVRAVKYDRSDHAARLLAEVLAEYLREEIASISSFSRKPVLLVPLPLHPNRLEERGFNQIEMVLDFLPREFKNGPVAAVAHDVLVRVRETLPQTHLSRAERLTNVKGAFALSNMDFVLGSHVILIDDVTTTGATLAEAARPLRNLDIPVNILAIARA
jgi:ComF family protein